jgi:hypothetical protein
MTVKKLEDYAERSITLWVSDVPNIDREITSTGKGIYVRKVTIEYVSENGAPWCPEYVVVFGIAVNKNGRLSMASNAEVSERFMLRSENMPAWLKGLAHDWNPSEGGH